MAEKLKAVGDVLLIKVDEVAEFSPGGIALIEDTRRTEELAKMTGTVVGIGDECWTEFNCEPWCAVGDRVYHVKYSGANIEHEGEKFRFVKDRDIMGRIVAE